MMICGGVFGALSSLHVAIILLFDRVGCFFKVGCGCLCVLCLFLAMLWVYLRSVSVAIYVISNGHTKYNI